MPADQNHVTSRCLRTLVVALAAVLVGPVGSALAFGGAYVRGNSFPTGWKAQALLIRVACPPQTQSTSRAGDFSFCTGKLTVRYRGRVVATAPFSIRTYDSHVEKARVVHGARSLFQPGRRLRVDWRARSHDGQGEWATNSGTVIVYNPYSTL
jgi:hypothetical protein